MIEIDKNFPKKVKAPLRVYVESPVYGGTISQLEKSIKENRELTTEIATKTGHMAESPYSTTLATAMVNGFVPDVDIQWYYQRILYSCDILFMSDTSQEWRETPHCVNTLEFAEEANMWICTMINELPDIVPDYNIIEEIQEIEKGAISHKQFAFNVDKENNI